MTKKSTLYTATGDKGMTSLVGGQRISKTALRLDCYGTVDELNSQIGLLRSEAPYLDEPLSTLQSDLFVLGAYLATDPSDEDLSARYLISEETIRRVERMIDEADAETPPMRGFILPAGCRAACVAHVARTVCRRCERLLYCLAETAQQGEGEPRKVVVHPHATQYLNRLSDLLFAYARLANHRANIEEYLWKS